MKAVANLDEDNADVIAHGKQQFFEVFCLCRSLVAEDSTTDLGHLLSENVLYVLDGIVRVLHDVMQQGGANTGTSQSHLLHGDACDGNGVHDVRFA